MSDQDRPISKDDEKDVKSVARMLKWLVVVLIVISAGNFIRSFYNQDATDKATAAAESVETTASEGRNAAVNVEKTLTEILAQLEDSSGEPGSNSQDVQEALLAIARIEGFLCGGKCEPVP